MRGVKCTRDSCCATVGAGWNIPCQRCPEKRECKRGFMKNTKTGTLTEESIIIFTSNHTISSAIKIKKEKTSCKKKILLIF